MLRLVDHQRPRTSYIKDQALAAGKVQAAQNTEEEEEEARKAEDNPLAMEEGRYNGEVDASNDTRTSYGEGDDAFQIYKSKHENHACFAAVPV
jgi:hypothetical protein